MFSEFDKPEDPSVADAPWPRLVDVPDAPAPGSYTSAIPDPKIGDQTQADLSVAAVNAEERAKRLAGPVIGEDEQADLILGYVVNQEVRSLEADYAAAEAQKQAEDEARREANSEPLEESGARQDAPAADQ